MKTIRYKYSRKEIADKWETTIKYSGNDLIRDLLAQKKDNKECKHKWRDAFADNGYFCDKCGMEVDNIPSLPEFEEIEPIQPDDIPMSDDVDFLVGKINQIVNTLNKLIKQK